jgi:micrococcal nuclease
MKNYYEILEVDYSASQDQIKAQHRFLNHAWHPDKFSSLAQKEKAEERIKEINEAYRVLGNPVKREQYDQALMFSQPDQAGFQRERTIRRAQARCEICNQRAETRHVNFFEACGKIRTYSRMSVKGYLCKACIQFYFWQFTGKTMLLGWWGAASFFLTPLIIINNIFRYILTLGMKKPSRQITPRPFSFWVYSLIGSLVLLFQAFFAIGIGVALSSDEQALEVAAIPTILPSPTDVSKVTTPLGATCIPPDSLQELALVTGIVDGDTIEVDIDGQTFPVQYLGVDAPEQDEPLFRQARTFNSNLVMGKTVRLVRDVSNVDLYDRLLRYVMVEGIFANYELILKGYARASIFKPDTACATSFMDAQNQARTNLVGLWLPANDLAATPTLVVPIGTGNCDPSYPEVCIASAPPDLDCGDIPFRNFKVLPPDPHYFDQDGDGIGCEN